jgi:uncharacterized OB-fold protein
MAKLTESDYEQLDKVARSSNKNLIEKVYCKDCDNIFFSRSQYVCNSYHNTTEVKRDNWFTIEPIETYIQIPSEINKNNDCKWFKEKEIPF